MSLPHDYYYGRDHHHYHHHDDPHLHNRHEGKPYIEPDYFAHGHEGALPLLSTVGRGPRGEGITAERDEQGNLFIKNEYGETLAQFSLGDWNISIVPNPTHNIQEGQNSYFDVIVDDGVGVKSERVIVPCGEQGSRVFLYNDGNLLAKNNQVYQILKKSLKPSERSEIKSYNPDPRVNDIIFAESRSGEENDLVIGYITRSYDDYVVMVESLRFPIDINYTYGEVKHVSFTTQYQLVSTGTSNYANLPIDGIFVEHVDHLDEFVPLSVSQSFDSGYNQLFHNWNQLPSALSNIELLTMEYYGCGFYYRESDSGGYDIFLAHSVSVQESGVRSEMIAFIDQNVGITSGSYTLAEHSDEEPIHDFPAIDEYRLEAGDIIGFNVCGSDDAEHVVASSFNDEVIHVPVGRQVGDDVVYDDRPFYLFYFDDHEGPMSFHGFQGNIKIDYDKTEDFILCYETDMNYQGTPHIQLTWKRPASGTTKQIEEHTATFDITIGEYSCTVYVDIHAGTMRPTV